MKKIFWVLLFAVGIASSASAQNARFYAYVYDIVKNEYLYDVDVSKVAENGLFGLSKMDSKVRISNGTSSVAIYYNGKIARTIHKPDVANNVDRWAEFTGKVIEAVKSVSPVIAAKDFEVDEYVLMSMFNNLDNDTRYYPYLEVGDKVNTVKQRYFVDRVIDDKILYMKLGPLNLYTRDSIMASLEKNKGFEALIIDLRGNPGGLLSEAVAVVKVFLDQGIIASSKARSDGVMNYYTTEEGSEGAIEGEPIVVLVDENTASSAEVLAAALQEQSVAKIVGHKTKGKGTVQKLIVLENGGELVLTHANFYTPSGRSVNGEGVLPDVELAEGEDAVEKAVDMLHK